MNKRKWGILVIVAVSLLCFFFYFNLKKVPQELSDSKQEPISNPYGKLLQINSKILTQNEFINRLKTYELYDDSVLLQMDKQAIFYEVTWEESYSEEKNYQAALVGLLVVSKEKSTPQVSYAKVTSKSLHEPKSGKWVETNSAVQSNLPQKNCEVAVTGHFVMKSFRETRAIIMTMQEIFTP